MSNELVSVIIPTFNRFKYLLNSIKSVLEQTHKNIEIIVVNDCSTDEEYYTSNFKEKFGDSVFIIHLPRNSRSYLGKVAGGGNARNIGMMLAKGDYIAFLDDDDYFLPTKIEKQLLAMKENNCKMCCTEGLIGHGVYNSDNKYNNYHYNGHYWNALNNRCFKNNPELLKKMYENEINIWEKDAIYTHNCVITSGVIIDKSIIKLAGYFPLTHYAEDWAYWKQIIKHTNCVFLRESLIYFDLNHGSGRNY